MRNPETTRIQWAFAPRSLVVLLILCGVASAEDYVPSAQRGLEALRTHCYLPADLDQGIIDDLWTVWPEPERSEAERITDVEQRRQHIYSYYGLMPTPPELPGTTPILGYTANAQGQWVMNCLTCHGGKVAGKVIPGLPNSHLALQTLTEDVRLIKLQQKKPFSHLDLATLTVPLSMTNGTTNSVIFGVILGVFRNPDMSVDPKKKVPDLLHHDVDAPPYWNVSKKSSLYIDGFAPKTHRPLMQFMLLPSNTKKIVYGWEDDFRDIQAWIESLQPPKYPWPIDASLAEQGRMVFNDHCARCHGTYGENGRYAQQTIPWNEIQTDRLRLDALTPEHRQWMKESWMSRYGEDRVELDPQGYIAPPLDGIWATAPYFHNGSVPTLWHVMHSTERPVIWKRTENGYDQSRVGLEIEILDEVPEAAAHPAQRRRYFDTRQRGKSAAGHRFPDDLSPTEKQAVLEYLKSL
ncbi:c-type cytochrome [bacterium]|nr:c-type cytochrome [bacterium]